MFFDNRDLHDDRQPTRLRPTQIPGRAQLKRCLTYATFRDVRTFSAGTALTDVARRRFAMTANGRSYVARTFVLRCCFTRRAVIDELSGFGLPLLMPPVPNGTDAARFRR